MAANTGKFYKEIECYVNQTVAAYAVEIDNVESIRCARLNDSIYMEVIHEDSCVRYFDITGLNSSQIGLMVSYILSNIPVNREIRDREDKKRVRRLFR